MTHRRPKIRALATKLIQSGNDSKDGLRWPPFISRTAVAAELDRMGYELVEDRAAHDPSLRRFFAAPKVKP